MIQSGFPNDKKLATQTSRDARLTFILMWIYSDDYAVVQGESIWLKSVIYPYDSILTLEVFESWLSELEKGGWIIPFVDNGDKYYFIRTFDKHQTINKPSKNRNPEPPIDILRESYGSDTEKLQYETELETEIEKKTGDKTAGFFQDKENRYFESIETNCYKIIELLKGNNSFNPFQMVQKFVNEKYHPGAINKSLEAIIQYFGTAIEAGPYKYIGKMIIRESQNFYEKENIEDYETVKVQFADFVKSAKSGKYKTILKMIGTKINKPETSEKR